jgi:hypothetical protein
MVEGVISRYGGDDYHDRGFTLIGRVPPPSEAEQRLLVEQVRSGASWSGWQWILDREDQFLGQQSDTD